VKCAVNYNTIIACVTETMNQLKYKNLKKDVAKQTIFNENPRNYV
jgi:hypothetical protein